MIKSVNLTAQQNQSVKPNRKKCKKSVAIHSNLFLNALGKEILAVDEKYGHLINCNKEQQENFPNLDIDEIENNEVLVKSVLNVKVTLYLFHVVIQYMNIAYYTYINLTKRN